METNKLRKARIIIYIFSIIIPLVVAILFGVKIEGDDFSFLPPIYATINGITAFVLVFALVAIKKKNKALHRSLIRFALLLSLLFLACYVAYHMTSDSTAYGGGAKGFYFVILIFC